VGDEEVPLEKYEQDSNEDALYVWKGRDGTPSAVGHAWRFPI